MWPGNRRVTELRQRFAVYSGRVIDGYRYKNLNWYLAKDKVNHEKPGEWFLFGDICEEDIVVMGNTLQDGEIMVLGWKDLGPDIRHDEFFGNGGGLILAFTNKGVIYDRLRDGSIKENHG